MHADELWNAPTFNARLLRGVLTPASWLYALGWQGYLAVYRLGIKKAKEPHAPVICVGNLVAGGTGKTPLTLHIADVLREQGREVAISCSGYGSPASEAARLAPEGPLMAAEWGDEAALIRWLRPEIPLIVGRRRVLAAEICDKQFPNAALLLDDGFQHLPLKKHVSILLNPPRANRRCLPAGPYREPRSNRDRADLVISAGPFRLKTVAGGFKDSEGGTRDLGGNVSVLCAIGQPGGFFDTLRAHGLNLSTVSIRADHDPLTDGNLLEGFSRDRPIVVTGKDWVKLRDRADVECYDIVIADYEVEVEPCAEFRSWLEKELNGIPNKEA